MPALRRRRHLLLSLIESCSDLFGPKDAHTNDNKIIGDPIMRKGQSQVTQLAVIPREPVLDRQRGGKSEFEEAKDGIGENVHLSLGGGLLGQ